MVISLFKRLNTARLLRFLYLLLLVILVISVVRNISQILSTNERISKMYQGIENIKNENIALKEEVDRVNSDEFLEKAARDKLGLAKQDEIVVVLPDEEILKHFYPKREKEEEVLPDPNWKKWAHLFGF